jgi:hypothetical protein
VANAAKALSRRRYSPAHMDRDLPPPMRRASARTALKGAARVTLPGPVMRDGQMCDLSVDGLSLMTPRPISPGTRCGVAFTLPFGGRPFADVTVQAKAVYSSYTGTAGFRIGMLFTALDDDARRLIDEFLST